MRRIPPALSYLPLPPVPTPRPTLAVQCTAVAGRAVLRQVLLPEPLAVKQRGLVRELLRAAMRLGAVT